jgi:DNA-binding GntR family transcriptional regulator
MDTPLAATIREIAAISDDQERARAIQRVLSEQQALVGDLARLRRETVSSLRASGMTQAQVAKILGVSPGRAAQLDAKPSVVVERSVPTVPTTRASASLYLTEAEAQGVTPRRQMLKVGATPAPAHIADLLRVALGDPVLIRRKLMLANEIPVRIADSYFTLEVAAGTPIAEQDFVSGGFQVYFDRVGRRFGHAVESFIARMPTDEETELLELGENVPVVQVVRCSYDTDDTPIHCLHTVCAADRHVFPVPQTQGDNVF